MGSGNTVATADDTEIILIYNGGSESEKQEKRDMPGGTIITEPYYIDKLVMVSLKK